MARKHDKYQFAGVIALVAAGCSWAAPVSSTDGNADGASERGNALAKSVADVLDKSGAGDAQFGRSRTLDLLIELQDKSPANEPGDRTRPTERTMRKAGTPAPVEGPRKPLQASPSNPPSALHQADTPASFDSNPGSGASLEWRPAGLRSGGQGSAASSEGGYAPPRVGAGNAGDSEDHLPLPRGLVRWIRENRSLVVGIAVGLLAVLWSGSIVVSGRGRR
jgi:hypothetical protein